MNTKGHKTKEVLQPWIKSSRKWKSTDERTELSILNVGEVGDSSARIEQIKIERFVDKRTEPNGYFQ